MSYIGKQPLVTPSSFTATADGAITDGDPCVIESAGTVAAVSETSQSVNLGTEVTPNSGGLSVTITYDSGEDKFLICSSDSSNYATARVATLNTLDDSLSLGTAASDATATTYVSHDRIAAYDPDGQKHLYVYATASNTDAFVITVSGTTTTFGTATTLTGYRANSIGVCCVGQDKFLIVMRDQNNSGYGTAVVATVSGTTVSFGTPAVFESALTIFPDVQYDSVNDKCLITYRDNVNSEYGTAIVATVSGTSVTFGSSAVFESGSIEGSTCCAYNQDTGNFFIAFQNSSFKLCVIAATISGTSVSFGTKLTTTNDSSQSFIAYDTTAKAAVAIFDEGTTQTGYTFFTMSGTTITEGTDGAAFTYTGGSTANSVATNNSGRAVLAHRDAGASSLKAKGMSIPYTAKNITAENFIGFADADYADGATATVQLSGAVDDAQSGLTAGQQYFVQNDGTLGTTADDPSVIAGVALSATEIAIDTSRD